MLAGTAAGQPEISIATAHDSEGENRTREQLGRILRSYDLDKWIFTRSVVIDERAIPHSHPILTLHTRHIGSDQQLLSTFVHEEIHWHLVAKAQQTDSAMRELMKIYPSVPSGGKEGARDTESSYRHLIVSYLEFQAMKELIGDAPAQELFEFWATDHYT